LYKLGATTLLSISTAACATLRPPPDPPVVIQAPPKPAEIPPPECQIEPLPPPALTPQPLPPALPESERTRRAAEYWEARARRGELAALQAIDHADVVRVDNESKTAVQARCAQWARDLAAREAARFEVK
jgi:hypothetical protein